DIMDKELAYLLWNALDGKDVHCLLIMDCCHSGNNTRAAIEAGDSGIRYRHLPSSRSRIPFHKYLGYDTGFYEVKDGKAGVRVARYVHLAAAQDAEKAQESSLGGLFTSKLVDVLRSGGTARSYRELVQGLTVTVSNRATQQHPVAFAREPVDLDLPFLGGGVRPYQPSFEVRYDFGAGRWTLYGGALHHIYPSAEGSPTTVRITGLPGEITVTEVGALTSVLDGSAIPEALQSDESLRAVVVRMAAPKLRIALSPDLQAAASPRAALEAAYLTGAYNHFAIDFSPGASAPDYLVRLTGEGAYALTRPGSDLPLFMRRKEADGFLNDVALVARWIGVADLKNERAQLSRDDFAFTLERIEGTALNRGNMAEWDGFAAETLPLAPDAETVFSYRGEQQPAFRLKIELKNPAIGECYIGALYLDSLFGMDPSFIDPDNARLVRGGEPLYLTWKDAGRYRKTIPLRVERGYRELNVNEVTEYLKLFVATERVDLERYRQEKLKLDKALVSTRSFKGVGMEEEETTRGADTADWNVFTFPFRIAGPNKEQKITDGMPAAFSSFTIEAPAGFSATVFAATGSDVQQKRATASRSADADTAQLVRQVAPPEGIWGEALSGETPFAPSLSAAAGAAVQVVELFPEGSAPLQLAEGTELLIRPKGTRSLPPEGLEETTIPYGFDAVSGLYFPVGYTDAEGTIHIAQLPEPTAGTLRGTEPLTRSLGGSIKLFFKKIFRKDRLNTLTLYVNREGKPWTEVSTDPQEIREVLGKTGSASVLLLLHGIIGDMKSITAGLKEAAAFSSVTQYVLTYDYENLSTPVAQTARQLRAALDEAGFGAAGHGQKLCIMAHSMGGLVSRCLVEKEGGSAFVSQVVFIGTPNGGSEMAHLRTSVGNLLTHALNVTGPLKLAITGLSFLLKKLEWNPLHTLAELDPGSDLLRELAGSRPPDGIPYFILAGDVTQLGLDYSGSDYFLKKVAEAVKRNIVYPALTRTLYGQKPNDIAVTLDSMQAIAGFPKENLHVVASDHLSYFTEEVCHEKLLQLFACAALPTAKPQTETIENLPV
ncbi:MAG TPA: hypothetical protein VHK69_05800, partial [Chitinophagaceae bacterium]|nr:hypothetical protein [Chitinophagaceae bacterium]